MGRLAAERLVGVWVRSVVGWRRMGRLALERLVGEVRADAGRGRLLLERFWGEVRGAMVGGGGRTELGVRIEVVLCGWEAEEVCVGGRGK